jgi:hypothetical protein
MRKLAPLRNFLPLQQAAKEFRGIHAMRRIVRTSVHTTWFIVIVAKVAGSRFLSCASNHAPRMVRIVEFNREGMQVNIPVGTIVRAQPAADAPILNDYFQSVPPPDRTDGAANHAQRIAALTARCRHQILIEPQPLADQSTYTLMSIRARSHALVATGTLLQIQNKQTLRFHQTLREKGINRNVPDLLNVFPVFLNSFASHTFEALPHFRKTVEHGLKIFTRDADHFYVIERRARGCARTAAQQANFPEESAATQIGQNHFPAWPLFGNLHEANSDQIKAIRWIALTADRLARLVTDQFHAVAKMVNEIFGQRRKNRHATQMRIQCPRAVIALQLRSECLVPLQNVEDIPKHF